MAATQDDRRAERAGGQRGDARRARVPDHQGSCTRPRPTSPRSTPRPRASTPKGAKVVSPGGAPSRRAALLRGAGRVTRRSAIALAALAVAGAWAYPSPASDGPRVVARTADGEKVAAASLRLPARGPSRSAYRHSVLPRAAPRSASAPAEDGRFDARGHQPRRARRCSTTTRSRARRRRTAGRWVLRPARPAALRARSRWPRPGSGGARSWPAIERMPLWRADGRTAHLRITVGGAMSGDPRRDGRPAHRGAAARGVRGRAPGAALHGLADERSSASAARRSSLFAIYWAFRPTRRRRVPRGVPRPRAAPDLPGLPRAAGGRSGVEHPEENPTVAGLGRSASLAARLGRLRGAVNADEVFRRAAAPDRGSTSSSASSRIGARAGGHAADGRLDPARPSAWASWPTPTSAACCRRRRHRPQGLRAGARGRPVLHGAGGHLRRAARRRRDLHRPLHAVRGGARALGRRALLRRALLRRVRIERAPAPGGRPRWPASCSARCRAPAWPPP